MIRTYRLDERTVARVGYPDGHVEVTVDLPFPLSALQSTATRELSADAILSALPALRHALRAARRAKGIPVEPLKRKAVGT